LLKSSGAKLPNKPLNNKNAGRENVPHFLLSASVYFTQPFAVDGEKLALLASGACMFFYKALQDVSASRGLQRPAVSGFCAMENFSAVSCAFHLLCRLGKFVIMVQNGNVQALAAGENSGYQIDQKGKRGFVGEQDGTAFVPVYGEWFHSLRKAVWLQMPPAGQAAE
jgi:hypothetical protein